MHVHVIERNSYAGTWLLAAVACMYVCCAAWFPHSCLVASGPQSSCAASWDKIFEARMLDELNGG